MTEAKRQQPILLDAQAYTETLRIRLPEGFAVDEVPDAEKLDTSFGRYSTSDEVKDGLLIFKRNFEVWAVPLPTEQYQTVRAFFERIRAAGQSPVVLAKK